MREGKELKAPRYASAATRDYITTRDIIPNRKTGLHGTITSNLKQKHFVSGGMLTVGIIFVSRDLRETRICSNTALE